jgi:hypothetical protein
MMKSTKMSLRALTFSAALCASLGTSLSAFAETIEVQKLKHAGPYPVATPWMADSVNVKGGKILDGRCARLSALVYLIE